MTGDTRVCLKEFENDPLENEFNDINKLLENEKQMSTLFNSPPVRDTIQLSMSKLNVGMFNANVNSGFGKEPRINIKKYSQKKNLSIKPLSVKVFI